MVTFGGAGAARAASPLKMVVDDDRGLLRPVARFQNPPYEREKGVFAVSRPAFERQSTPHESVGETS
jgi:hypothetical protein